MGRIAGDIAILDNISIYNFDKRLGLRDERGGVLVFDAQVPHRALFPLPSIHGLPIHLYPGKYNLFMGENIGELSCTINEASESESCSKSRYGSNIFTTPNGVCVHTKESCSCLKKSKVIQERRMCQQCSPLHHGSTRVNPQGIP